MDLSDVRRRLEERERSFSPHAARSFESRGREAPEEPSPEPEPDFPFDVVYFVHDTGSQAHTRMTVWVREDFGPGFFNTLDGYQMRAVSPDGTTHLSDLTGPGFGDSTVKGTGDNHNMNAKLEFAPYVPGSYLVSLLEGGVQVSPEVEVNLSADPQQYIHFDFFWQKSE